MSPAAPSIEVYSIVRPIGNDAQHAFFRVLSLRRGWVTCRCLAYASGVRATPDVASVAKFRARQLQVIEQLPPAPRPQVNPLHP